MEGLCDRCGGIDSPTFEVKQKRYADQRGLKLGQMICKACRWQIRKEQGGHERSIDVDEILKLSRDGMTGEQIAEHLSIGYSTVYKHLKRENAALRRNRETAAQRRRKSARLQLKSN